MCTLSMDMKQRSLTSILDPTFILFSVIQLPPSGAQPLASSTTPPQIKRMYSFLSIVFGLWANVDIGTESMRWMGDSRWDLQQSAVEGPTLIDNLMFWLG